MLGGRRRRRTRLPALPAGARRAGAERTPTGGRPHPLQWTSAVSAHSVSRGSHFTAPLSSVLTRGSQAAQAPRSAAELAALPPRGTCDPIGDSSALGRALPRRGGRSTPTKSPFMSAGERGASAGAGHEQWRRCAEPGHPDACSDCGRGSSQKSRLPPPPRPAVRSASSLEEGGPWARGGWGWCLGGRAPLSISGTTSGTAAPAWPVSPSGGTP